MHKILLPCLVVLLFITGCKAQKLSIPDDANKKAVKLYEKGMDQISERKPLEAIKYFTRSIEKDPDFIQAAIMRGSVYYDLKDYKKAEKDFQLVIDSGKDYPLKVHYTMGFIQWHQDKFEAAGEHFDRFVQSNDARIRMIDKAKRFRDYSRFAVKAMADPLPFNPQSVGDKINTEVNEYLPSITADGKSMLFTRRVGRSEFLFFSELVNGEWTEPQSMEIINRYMESGAHAISADGKYIVFTSCEREDGYGSCDLYYTHKRNGEWIPPRNLGPRVNSAAWDSQPTLADNGRTLYFCSNRQGTIGSKDLWVTRRLPNGRWSRPLNLGPDINTVGDEKAPYIHFDGETLYFMSNEHQGMGDFDLFMTKRISDTEWQTPMNVGYPINTKFHDGTLSIDISGQTGYITSDRHHEGDLRKGNLSKSETDIYSFDIPSSLRPEPSTFVVFHVRDQKSGLPLVARIQVLNNDGEAIFYGKTDEDGEMLIVLPLADDYGIQVASEGYTFFSERLTVDSTYSLVKPLDYIVELTRPEAATEEPIVLKNILFESGSDRLKSASLTEIEYLYELLSENPGINIEIRGHTDDVGQPGDNLQLSISRANRIKSVLVDKGIEEDRIATKGFGESQPIADNDSEEGRRLNRRTEFVILKQ